ncbi:hypothetical protein JCM19992_18680 [Thermostilla marina]
MDGKNPAKWLRPGRETGPPSQYDGGLDRAAVFLQRLHTELEVAARIHQSLLPSSVEHPDIEVDVRYQPLDQIGGDYCQIRFSDRDTCYLTISDVCGHGFGAALLATRISSEVRHGILYGLAPSVIVSSLMEFFYEFVPDCGLFFSFFITRIDLADKQLTWCGAGHPPGMLLKREGRDGLFLNSQNPLVGIGVGNSKEPCSDQVSIRPGDRLVLYTDGLTEAPNRQGRPIGTRHLMGICLSAFDLEVPDASARIFSEVSQFESGRATDDRTLIVAQFR